MIGANRRAVAAALAGMIALGACSRAPGHYHVDQQPAVLGQVINAILPALRKPPLPVSDPNNPKLAEEVIVEDPDDPMQAEKTVIEPNGQAWVFPGPNRDQSLRVHWIYGAQGFSDTTDFEVQVEVRTPYAKTIDGQQVMITQEFADKKVQAALAQMVEAVNAESWRQIRDDPKTPGAPLVAALRDLVPWQMAQPGHAGNPWSR